MHPCSCLRPCLQRGIFFTGFLVRFSTHLSHLNALFYDSPIPLFFICSHLLKGTNYDVHLYIIFSNFLLENLLGPQSHSPQNPVWELFIQIRTTTPEMTNFTLFIWTRSRHITKTRHTSVYMLHTEYKYLWTCARNGYHVILISHNCQFMLINLMYFRILIPVIPIRARYT